VLVMALVPLLLLLELEVVEEDDEPHATAADMRAAAPMTSAPRLGLIRTAVLGVTVSPLVPMGR
jgi:hypothetical protein